MFRIKTNLLIPCALAVCSCADFVDIPGPVNELTQKQVLIDDRSATAVVSGIYSSMVAEGSTLGSVIQIAGGLYAGELDYTGNDDNYLQFSNRQLLAANSYVSRSWSDFYKFIYYANALLEGLTQPVNVTSATASQLEGEARLIRGFCYFYLTNLWGAVPLVTSTAYQSNMLLPKTPVEEINDAIIEDLKKAVALLPEQYVSAERCRPNKYTAMALLARVQLQLGDWQNAEANATAVIEHKLYQLEPIDRVFLKESQETIWQLMTVSPLYNTVLGYMFIPNGTATPRYPVAEPLLNSFEPGDTREKWTQVRTNTRGTFYFPFKYRVRFGGSPLNEYPVVLRLGEQYLIRAEARAMSGNITGAAADINAIRQRAGVSPLPDLDIASPLDTLAGERFRELFTEWGDRWLTIKRFNTRHKVLLPPMTELASRPSWVWPIPFSQLQNNPFLEQNEGY